LPSLYLIKRGPRPDHHRAPFHPYLICDRKKIAKWEAGSTDEAAWLWEKFTSIDDGYGWLLCRWNGFDVDFGPVVHGIRMPDGVMAGFWRDYDSEYTVKDYFDGAVWWSNRPMPEWLQRRGVIYPPDTFTQGRILEEIRHEYGIHCELPEYWPEGRNHE
jgi:hypothetical protein